MKDTKFVVLLFLITAIALINVIWLTRLQVKIDQWGYSHTAIKEAAKTIQESAEVIKKSVWNITNPKVRSLTIIDEQGRDRIWLAAWENNAAIDILDYEEQIIVRLFAYIYGENEDSEAGLKIEQLPWDRGASAKGIIINTIAGFPKIELINIYGEGTQIQANKMKNFPLGTWGP